MTAQFCGRLITFRPQLKTFHCMAAILIGTSRYIGYTAIGYSAKSAKGWVLRCPDLPTVNLIGYNAKNRLQCGVKSVITRI